MKPKTIADESGASAAEYALLVAGIAAVIVAIVFLFGGTLSNLFSDSCGTVAAKLTGRSC